jgi:hypothetical protein
MTDLKLLSAALIAVAMLATPAVARTSHVSSQHLAEDANASASLTAHYNHGPVAIRAPRLGGFARVSSDGGACDVGDDPRIC